MEDRQEGKFCQTCRKTVIDFSEKSLEELRAALQQNGEVCGRFRSAQLGVTPYPGSVSLHLKRVAAGLLLALGFTTWGRELKAQEVICHHPDHQHRVQNGQRPFGMVAEIMPSFKHGGDQGMMAYLAKNIVYPADLPNGLVVVTFVIDTTGAVCDPKVAKSLTPRADQEALRVVRLLEFVPAMQAGKNVAFSYTLPIRFSNGERKAKKGN